MAIVSLSIIIYFVKIEELSLCSISEYEINSPFKWTSESIASQIFFDVKMSQPVFHISIHSFIRISFI